MPVRRAAVRWAILTGLLLLPLPVRAARQPPVLDCPDARYFPTSPLGPPLTAIRVEAGRVMLENACGVAAARLSRSRQRVHGRPLACQTKKHARLTARFEGGCARLVGKVFQGRRGRPFEAMRSRCGDGILDASNAEQCETNAPCASGFVCTAACACVASTIVTTTTTTGSTATHPSSTVTTTTTTIRLPRCGDGVRQGLEQCDGDDLGGAVCPSGSTGGAPTCTSACRLDYRPCERCGDGDRDPGELCDDGNTVSGDGCSATCGDECGDGMIEPTEHCDDGGRTAGDGCSKFCGWEPSLFYAGDGGQQPEVCALEWGAATASPFGPTLHCTDGHAACDRGPAADQRCRFQLYFCVNNPSLNGTCTWGGVARVELTGGSLSGPTQLSADDRSVVLGAFATMLSRWGGATVSGDDPLRVATPIVQAEVCGQFQLDVARAATKTVAVRISDAAVPANVDIDHLTLVCDP